MSQQYTQLANDRRTVRCFKTRNPPKTRKDGMLPGEVAFSKLKAEIARGYEYFMQRRPGLHRHYSFSPLDTRAT